MSLHEAPTAEVDLIVAAVPVPVFVADYRPIIERFEGLDGDTVRALLIDDESLLAEVLTLPLALAASPEWTRLYGSPLSPDPPDLADRHFSRQRYPELHRTLVEQFTAPFYGITSIVREHTAPTLFGDVTVRSHWKPLVDAHGPMWDRVVIVDLDVTDLRAVQKDLERILDTKEQLVVSKDKLIASVSHEIRTPLASIVGFAQLLQGASDLAPEERQEMIEMLVSQSADLTNIIDDLLVAAKTDLGKLEISSVAVDLRAQAAQAVEGLDSVSRQRVKLTKTTTRCYGDPARTRQIIRNLVANAFKYGGPEIEIEVEAGAEVGALRVIDNGEGIPIDSEERIFEAYERAGRPSDSDASLGLGLHISRTLAHRMGGDLTYRFEGGKSIFELTLPLVDAAPPAV
jgi:signal transduction histidine kinase